MPTEQPKHLLDFLLNFATYLRADVVAHYHPPAGDARRGTYSPVRAPLTLKDVERHLGGEQALGLYVFKDALGVKGQVAAAVVDLDDKKKEYSLSQIYDFADVISRMLAQRGLLAWPCRSGSGHGVHLWLFWAEPVDARRLRTILKDVCDKSGVKLHIDLFPAGDSLQEGQLGNLVALPLGRASRPLAMADGKLAAVEDLTAWLPASLPLSAPLAGGKAGGLNHDELKRDAGRGARGEGYGAVDLPTMAEALAHVPNHDYDTWMRMGMAIKRAAYDGQFGEEDGFKVWDDWARSYEKYSERDSRYNWERFRPDGSLNMGILWNLAQESGWKPTAQDLKKPKPSRKQVQALVDKKIAAKAPASRAEAEAMRRLPWLSGEGPEHIHELNDNHFLSPEGGRVYIFKEDYDSILKRRKLTRIPPFDFKLLYQNQKIQVGENKKGVPIMEDLGKAWLEDPYRRQYDEIVLMPEGCEPWRYNLWRGWTAEPSQDGSCELLKEHMLNNICSGHQDLYAYLFSWLAQTFQKPYEPIGTAVVLRGEKGTGKGTFAHLLGNLFGQHYLHLTSSRDLTGRFNSHLQDCIFMFADEAVWAGGKSEVSTLNGLITEQHLFIEGKGRDGYPCRNMLHLVIATNNEWSVPAGMDERRYFALKVSSEKKQNRAYFTAIKDQFFNEGGRERMLWELLNHDVREFSAYDVPKTDELMEQKVKSLDPLMEWWLEKLREGILMAKYASPWEMKVPAMALYLDYVHRCRLAGHHYPGALGSFTSRLKNILPKDPETRRERLPSTLFIGPEQLEEGTMLTYYFLPSLGSCREFFDQKSQSKTAWKTPEPMEAQASIHDDKPLL